MDIRTTTEELLAQFNTYLLNAERSKAMIEKYNRDIVALYQFVGAHAVTKSLCSLIRNRCCNMAMRNAASIPCLLRLIVFSALPVGMNASCHC